MRTTLTIEDFIFERLNEKAHRERKSFKQVVNETLSRGLLISDSPSQPEHFSVKVHACGRREGIDYGKLNQLSDEIEAAEHDHT
ncbi:MAG: DUF2191 domain-containing protein [Spirochaetota bacterium]|nr:DUF2191 domain-containing protein [Spirochaetota bacterium]